MPRCQKDPLRSLSEEEQSALEQLSRSGSQPFTLTERKAHRVVPGAERQRTPPPLLQVKDLPGTST